VLTVDISLPDVEELHKLVAEGKEKGFLSYDEIVNGLDDVDLTKEQVEDFYTYLAEHGVDLVEGEQHKAPPHEQPPPEDEKAVAAPKLAWPHELVVDHKAVGVAGVFDRVDGPLLSTFTAADHAVGWWYPTASMLNHQNAESLTDLTYEWGGMGHDGFQQSPAGTTVELGAEGFDYGFEKGVFYLLDSNKIICANQSAFSGAHSDIQHPEVAWAVVAAATTPQP